LDAAHTGAVERLGEVLANLDVLGKVVSVALTLLGRIREPARHVVGRNPEAEAVGMNLLAHTLGSLLGGRELISRLQNDRDVARALVNTERAALRPGAE